MFLSLVWLNYNVLRFRNYAAGVSLSHRPFFIGPAEKAVIGQLHLVVYVYDFGLLPMIFLNSDFSAGPNMR